MVSIRSVSTIQAPHHYSASQIASFADTWLGAATPERDLFQRFASSSQAEGRRFVLEPERLLSLGGLAHRRESFEACGTPLGVATVREALAHAGVACEDIGGIVFSSCSCPVIPSIDAIIAESCELPREVVRLPVFQHGCAGGVVGLQLAAMLARDQARPVVLSSVELCSLLFQFRNKAPAQLVGAAIFADGAAAVVVDPHDHGLVLRARESFLVPETRHLMGYDIFDDGFHLRLDRELPQALAAVAPRRVERFLAGQGLRPADVPWWLFHPGGVKILDFLEHTFALDEAQSRWAREVLRSCGNLSSATILFVLKSFLESRVASPGDTVLMLGVGPGLTIELLLFEWRGAHGE